MTDDEWFFISGCLSVLEKQHDRLNDAANGLMIAPESPLIDPFFSISDALLLSLGMIAGDNLESLEWFVYECDYGRKPKKAGRDGDMRLIDTHDKLRWLIEVGCD